jgi:hypothetical protein
MANKFGEAALIAARLDVPETVSAPERWDVAVRQLYPEKPYLQKKTAPRGAFLGLCEEGLVKGIARGQYAPSSKHKVYALRAVERLAAGTQHTVNGLWADVTEGEEVAHNAQMDVVLALWKNGLIASKS